jgi:hypothetical protein
VGLWRGGLPLGGVSPGRRRGDGCVNAVEILGRSDQVAGRQPAAIHCTNTGGICQELMQREGPGRNESVRPTRLSAGLSATASTAGREMLCSVLYFLTRVRRKEQDGYVRNSSRALEI